ncbi:MAG: hypothetical protein HY822_17830 [Acidobacteria bacterium]|nr:hypothetical protein [Acidobacteriota bacterium]
MAKVRQPAQDPAFLNAALEGLELQRNRIEEQIRYVRSLLGRKRPAAFAAEASSAPAPVKRELSDAARKRIALAQKRRWAEYRKAKNAAAKGGD